MNFGRTFKVALFLPVLAGLTAAAQEPSDRYYAAVRDNDIPSLRAVLKSSDVNLRDTHGTTPLMYAAAVGSVDAMKMLLKAGADVNAKNAFDATALMWCINQPDMVELLLAKSAEVNARSKIGRTPLLLAASYAGNTEVLKLLLAKGADVLTRDKFENTPLLAATAANDTVSVKLLLEHGADFKGTDIHSKEFAERVPTSPATAGLTPLMNAAAEGNVEVVRLLLARGADVNTVSSAKAPSVKNGPIGLASFTALTVAAAYGGPETIQALLDHNANVNAQDVRGMTPLMLAISTDRADPRVIRLLLDKGADPNLKSRDGETAMDWAKKFHNAQVMEALGLKPNEKSLSAVRPVRDGKPLDLTEALTRSIALLQRVNSKFMNTGGCVSCHGQNLTAMAVHAARTKRVQVNEPVSAEQAKMARYRGPPSSSHFCSEWIRPGERTMWSIRCFRWPLTVWLPIGRLMP